MVVWIQDAQTPPGRHYDRFTVKSLQWHHNGHDSVSNHQSYGCLFNHLFRRRSRKYQSSASLAFVRGIHRWPVNSPHKWPVTRKMFPFDDVIMMAASLFKPRFLSRCSLVTPWSLSSLVQTMSCRLFDVKPLPKPLEIRCQYDHRKR